MGQSVVIFICSFDPIGFGDRKYLIKPAIVDRWSVFEDGTTRIFLNAYGASQDASLQESVEDRRLASFLSYIDGGGTMGDEWVERLDHEVKAFNADEGWRATVLGLELDFEHARHLAQKEGRARGLAEGREVGLAEGREAGIAEGREAAMKEAKRIDSQLTAALAAADRLDELPKAMLDSDVKARLLKEFGIV